jgi:hypothetical protein
MSLDFLLAMLLIAGLVAICLIGFGVGAVPVVRDLFHWVGGSGRARGGPPAAKEPQQE